ncbi:alpha/beta hydrolase [Algirhabdus cladophorae]|uniref:alpha/beta hydrolase n=1 Tax=Algirhabdus cladophorae TaxID=3377108 RepID=UPI003B84AEE8
MNNLRSKFLVPLALLVVLCIAYFVMAPQEAPMAEMAPEPVPMPVPMPEPTPAPAPETSAVGSTDPGDTSEESVMEAPVIVEETVVEGEEKDYKTVELYFATNRKKASASQIKEGDPASQFSNARGTLEYGTVTVSIPREHKMGTMESQSWLASKFFNPDPEKHVVLQTANIWSRERMLEDINAKLADRSDKAILLFVHGYNTSYDKAARRTGQVVYDLAFHGPAMFFSWPSQARTRAYTVDAQTAQWAVPDMTKVLKDLTSRDADRIIVIAHSMGTRVLSRGLDALIRDTPEAAEKITTVVLAAPDIDADVFKQQLLPSFRKLTNPATVYASDGDTALLASEKVNGQIRLGDTSEGISAMDGIEYIDASGFKSDFFGHTYFGDNASILSDIFRVVCTQKPAKDRNFLAKLEVQDTSVTPAKNVAYWKMVPPPKNQRDVALDPCAL